MSRTIIRVPGFAPEASQFTSSDNYRSKVRYTYSASAITGLKLCSYGRDHI